MIVRSLRKTFYRVEADGLDRLRATLDAEPEPGIVFAANHSCWWDLYMAHFLNETIPVDGFGMMEHFNLRRFGFFRRIGAFSVDRTQTASVRAALDYTAGLLRRPRAGVWVFPQGKILPNDLRPLAFQAGLRALLRRAGQLRVVPVAFRYEFLQEQRPEAFVRFGSPLDFARSDAATILERVEAQLTTELDALVQSIQAGQISNFTLVMRGPRSINERFAAVQSHWRGKSSADRSP